MKYLFLIITFLTFISEISENDKSKINIIELNSSGLEESSFQKGLGLYVPEPHRNKRLTIMNKN